MDCGWLDWADEGSGLLLEVELRPEGRGSLVVQDAVVARQIGSVECHQHRPDEDFLFVVVRDGRAVGRRDEGPKKKDGNGEQRPGAEAPQGGEKHFLTRRWGWGRRPLS
jgi:hypothetical protein